MISVGVDMVELERIKKSMKNPGFLKKVFSGKELELLKEKNFCFKSVGAMFCAKEAFAKSVGTGFRGFKLCEINVLRNELNKPYILLEGSADALFGGTSYEYCVSLTHTENYACAVVIRNEKTKEMN